MKTKDPLKAKAKAHQRYLTKDGRPCVGVTTALKMQNKPHLITWANRLGLEGVDVNKYLDVLSNVGTLTHLLVEHNIKGTEPDLTDCCESDFNIACTSLKKFLDWKENNDFELIASELQLAHDDLQYGGTCDIYAKVNGKKCVLDIKTAKACYSEQRTQVVAYKKLLEFNGYEVDECRILRIGRDENEGFEDVLIGAHELHWERFKACLALYWADKNLERAGG
jgi:hypothetical protein